MDTFLSTEVLAGILVGFSVLALGLIALQVWNGLQIRRMSKTAYQEDVREAQVKAVDIVSEARAKAESMLLEANEEGARAMAEAGKKARQTNEQYQAELQKLIDRYNEHLSTSLDRGQQSFTSLSKAAADSFNRRQEELNTQFDDVLESLSEVASTLNNETNLTLKALEGGIDETTKKLELMLSQGEAVVKERVAAHLEKLLDRAEADVEEYKKARVTLLDSHIERLIEDIAVRVLHKKLSLDEHAELAIQALEDAKTHNVL